MFYKESKGMKRVYLIVVLVLLAVSSFGQQQMAADSLVFQDFMAFAAKRKVVEMKTGDRIATIASYFLDAPYVGGMLDTDPEKGEFLRVNFRQLDCMTFVETVLALHNTLKDEHPDFSTYQAMLTSIRYRDGVIAGYTSRLHYTTDWLFENRKRKHLRFVRMGCAAKPFAPDVYFMSTHPASYPLLKDSPEDVKKMADHEARIRTLRLAYLPKDKLTASDSFLQTGDIVAFTTSYSGLDFSHLGFVIREKNKVYLLHASTTGKKVQKSSLSLKDYLSDIKKHTGIVVARPL